MANLFMDYLNGNNANAGTSFALRFKDITSGATAARIAPGDVIRIMKSPDPTSLGITGTWTQGSPTITLASAVTANIATCETSWTASANVTCTTSATCKEGSNSASIALATAFATGKAAYFATGTLDLSGYQQVSFWVRTNSAVANTTTLSLRLCTDTTGDVSVHTVAIPALPMTNIWTKVTVDLATNLNSAIKSIALYQDTDRAAVTLLLDNIIACKASSSADSLSLTSLIGKNTANETWYPIASINGTTVRLDNGTNSLPSAQRGYGGTTETVTTYKRETIKTGYSAAATTAVQTVQDSGSVDSPITYSGGWDTTNMTTQDGETWFDGGNGGGIGLTIANRSYITLSKINFVNYGNAAISITGTSNNQVLNDVSCNGNTLDGLVFSASGASNTYSNLFLCNNGQCGANGSSSSITLQSGVAVFDGNTSGAGTGGFYINGATGTTFPLIRSSCNGGNGQYISSATNCTFTSLVANYNSGNQYGMNINAATGSTITAVEASNNTVNNAALVVGSAAGLSGITAATCSNNTGAAMSVSQSNLAIGTVTANSNTSTGLQLAGNSITLTELVSANSNATGVLISGSSIYIPTITAANSNSSIAISITGNCNKIDTVVASNSNTGTAIYISGVNNTIGPVTGDGNGTGVQFVGDRNTINSLTLTNTVTQGIHWMAGSDNRILSGSQAGGTQGMSVVTGTGVLHNFTISNATELTPGNGFTDYRIASLNHDNTTDNHQIFCDGGLISSESTTRHTASGLAWKVSPTSANRSSTYPLKLPLGLYALDAGTVTIKCWMRRSNTGLTAKLVAPVTPAMDLATETSTPMTAIADTWEEVTLVISPSSKGVIELQVHCYGGTAYSCYIDDLTVNGVAVPLDYSWEGQPFCSPLVSAGGGSAGGASILRSSIITGLAQ